jgi:hypothetical protein
MVNDNSEKSAESAESAKILTYNICDVNHSKHYSTVPRDTIHNKNDNGFDKKGADGAKQFVCVDCDFICYKLSNYNRHISTNKHKKLMMKNIKNAKKYKHQSNESITNICPNCNKKYSHLSGLSRHKKTCITSNSVSSENVFKTNTDIYYSDNVFEISQTNNIIIHKSPICNNIDSLEHQKTIKDLSEENREMKAENREMKQKMNMMLQMMATNSQFQSQILELMKMSHPQITNDNQVQSQPLTTTGIAVNGDNNTLNTNTTTTTNNSNNNTFNMNMFLNEKCKDAMNMKDFVNSIQLNMTDLENVGRLGYVEGMSNIFIDNLEKTDLYKRPVHCSDVKRETLYVKDNNQWEREGPDHVKMTNAVLAVEHKNVALVSEWAKANPRCMNSNTRENETYFKLSKAATDGEKDGNIDKVIRKVAKSVAIEKRGLTIEHE